MPTKKTVLCACQTPIATKTSSFQSRQYVMDVNQLAREHGLEVEAKAITTTGSQIEAYIQKNGKPDLIIGDPVEELKRRIPRVPVVSGMPLFTRIGKKQAQEEIVKILKK